MTLRLKTLLLVGAALVGLVVVAYLAVSLVLQAGFADVEAENTRQNVRRAMEGLSEKIAGLDKSARDYAGWDDTYAFIEDRNQDYIDANLGDETFANNELSLMMFVNLGGEVVFAKAYDLHGEVEVPIPAGLLDQLPALGRLVRHESVDSSVAGVLLLSDGPMLVASRPILTSEYEGPIRGALIMGRVLDTALVQELAAITRLDLALARLDDAQLPPDFQRAVSILSGAEQIRVEALSEESIAGYTLLSDISGQPRLIMRVDTPRPVYQQGQRSLQAILISIAGAGLVFVALVLLLLERSVLQRLVRLRNVVQRLGEAGVASTNQALEGSDALAQLSRREPADEIGTLTRALDHMSGQLHDLIASLEARVAARTEQLRASADVGRAAVSVLDPDRLLHDVVNLITNRFGFYYAAVFLTDEKSRYAVLREATGEAGRILKERGHKLEVGGQSMVGFVTAQRRPRIALDVGEESARFANPLLPDTRSEIALPLVVGDRVLGALDVQSTQGAAFDEASAAVLQGMADQIAIALNNAALYAESQRSVNTMNELLAASSDIARSRTLPELTGLALSRVHALVGVDSYYLGLVNENQTELRFVVNVLSGVDVSDVAATRPFGSGLPERVIRTRTTLRVSASEAAARAAQPGIPVEEAQRGAFLGAPVVVGERVLGVLGVQDMRPDSLFSDDQERLVVTLAGQIAVALDNLRLAEETRQALADLDAANRLLTGQAWRQYARTARSLSGEWQAGEWSSRSPQESADRVRSRLTIPLRIRGETVGDFDLLPLEDRDRWTPEDEAFAQSLVDQVGQTLETVRLLEETERLAGRERLINEINARVRQTVNIDGILQTAVDELGRSLKAARVVARIGAPAKSPTEGSGERSAADPEKRDGRGDDHA